MNFLSLTRRKYDTPCTVEVSQTRDAFHAHVILDDGFLARPGDRVRVHGAPVRIAFDQCISERRVATVERASWLERLWTRCTSRLEFNELYDVSFTSRTTL
jgi:hypothetical protein